MSTKREPLLGDEEYDALDWLMMPPHVADNVDAALKKYEAARAKDAELIQRLVDALWDCVPSGNSEPWNVALDAAASAGFTPSQD